jgi:hypothetical protein
MSGIAKLYVSSVNGDNSLNGYRLFNKNRIVSAREWGSGTLLNYHNHNIVDSVISNAYILTDSISDIYDLMGDYTYDYYGVSVCSNQDDITSDTVTRVINAHDILYGYPFGASNCVLYVRRGNKIDKLMCSATLDNFIESDSENYLITTSGDILVTKDGSKIKYI